MTDESQKNTDHEAFLRLFTRFEGNLRAFVASLLPTWDGVDEAMQEASVVLWRKFAQFDQSAGSGFLDWAFMITETRLLKESEFAFGTPDVDYPTPRAVEPRPEGDERPGFDSVILAADQRTLIFDLNVAPHKLDQLRVLVDTE